MTGPQLAARVRKARGNSVCAWPGCHLTITIGNLIGRVPGYGWCHVECIIATNRQERP